MIYRVTIVAEFESKEEIENVLENTKLTVDKAIKLKYKVFEVEEIRYKKLTAEDLLK